MIEDKLSHDERLRLECVAQAIAFGMRNSSSVEGVIHTAARFEKFVKEGINDAR